MAAGNYSFKKEQGATTDFELVYKDTRGNPVDLTGSTLGIDIYESIFSSAVSGTILIWNTDGIVSKLF